MRIHANSVVMWRGHSGRAHVRSEDSFSIHAGIHYSPVECLTQTYRRVVMARKEFVVACLVALSGCAGTRIGHGYVDDTPDEILRLIDREYSESVYAVGTATGSDEGLAMRKASLQARSELARQFKAQIDVLQKNYEESVNERTVGEYQQVTEIFAALAVTGSREALSVVRQEKDGSYTAKVLVVVSAEQLKAMLDEKMQSYTSFRASKAYEELEERVARERAGAGEG